MAFTVCMQSSLGRNPRSVHTPFDKAATITARCEMLLSPGTVISMSIRGARFTRNSIANKKGTDTGCLNAALWKTLTALVRHPECMNQHRRNRLNHRGMQVVTAQERSCRCKGPSLLFLEGILRHRYICQGNKDSPPSAVCQAPEFHTDNLPSRLLWTLLAKEVWSPAVLLAADSWAELARSD